MKEIRRILQDARRTGIMPLSAFCIALASYALLTTPICNHADFGVHSECQVSRFAEVLSYGDKVKAYAMAVPDFQYIALDSGGIIRIPLIVIPADSTRAPPPLSA